MVGIAIEGCYNETSVHSGNLYLKAAESNQLAVWSVGQPKNTITGISSNRKGLATLQGQNLSMWLRRRIKDSSLETNDQNMQQIFLLVGMPMAS